jgi:uncharacterized membrane protein
MMGYYLKLYFATLVAFFAIDLVWLGLVARTFYHKYIGFLMAPSVNWPAALIFYLLFVVGLVVFAVLPGLEAGSLKTTVGRAALFGLIAYATYDLTNLATLKDWPLIVTAVDLAWGTVLSVAVSCVGYLAGKWLS